MQAELGIYGALAVLVLILVAGVLRMCL